MLGLFVLGTALNGVHWALYLLMESRFVVDFAFNTSRVLRKMTPKVFLHAPTINHMYKFNCEQGTAMKNSIYRNRTKIDASPGVKILSILR